MEKKESSQSRKRAYIPPVTRVVSAEPTSMTCATVTPNGNSSSGSWGAEDPHEAGSIYFGNQSDAGTGNISVSGWEDGGEHGTELGFED